MNISGSVAGTISRIDFDCGLTVPLIGFMNVLDVDMMHLISPGGKANNTVVIAAGFDIQDTDVMDILRAFGVQIVKWFRGVNGVSDWIAAPNTIGMERCTRDSIVRRKPGDIACSTVMTAGTEVDPVPIFNIGINREVMNMDIAAMEKANCPTHGLRKLQTGQFKSVTKSE